MDIVERLRQRIGLVKFDSDAIALHDAADTIEQLRGQVDFERECREDTYADLEKQDAKIERLRKVLRQITELSPFKYNTGHASLQYITQMLVEMTALAHEALKEKE
jgi:hypothetical protein